MVAQALHSGNVFIYMAYTFLLFSYLNVNILILRLLLIGASVSFICFAITVGNVFIDSLVFNSVFIIINGAYCYFLLLKYLPIKLSPLEERIYQKDFKGVMDRRCFQSFIRRAHLRTFSEGGQICHQGNNFSGPFYVAMVNPNYKIVYIQKGKEYFEVKENSWIGVVEYTMHEKNKKVLEIQSERRGSKININDENVALKQKKKAEKVKWGLDAVVKERNDGPLEGSDAQDPIFEVEGDPCYVYEFPLGELERLFLDKDEGVIFRNALYSVWLAYTTKGIIGIDDKVKAKMQQRKYMQDAQRNLGESQNTSGVNNGLTLNKLNSQNEDQNKNKKTVKVLNYASLKHVRLETERSVVTVLDSDRHLIPEQEEWEVQPENTNVVIEMKNVNSLPEESNK